MNMKRIVLILLLMGSVLMVTEAQWRRTTKSEPQIFYQFDNDTTLTVETSDNICFCSLYCPAGSVDSIAIIGETVTIDDRAANGLRIPPGEGINLGTGDLPIHYLYITVRQKAQIYMIKCD